MLECLNDRICRVSRPFVHPCTQRVAWPPTLESLSGLSVSVSAVIVWSLQGLQIGFEDLRLVDTIICQFLTAIRSCEDDGLTSDEQFRGEHSVEKHLVFFRTR